MGVACKEKHRTTADRKIIVALLFVIAFLIINRYSSSSTGHTSSQYVVTQHGPAAAGSQVLHSLRGAAQNSQNQQHQSQQQQQQKSQQQLREPSEWDTHIIYNGNKDGRLDECPTDSSTWPEGSWVAPLAPSDTHTEGLNPSTASAGFMLPHSTEAQDLVWQHQHPKDCSTAKFLLYHNPALGEGSHGVGSVLHLETAILGIAMSAGRVLVEVPGTYLTDHPYCGDRNTLDSCYFRPLTHCKVTAKQIEGAYKLNGTAGSPDQALFNAQKWDAIDALGQFVIADKMFPQKSRLVHNLPTPFKQMLADSGIPSKNLYYFWRSQAAAYIVRPNEQALQEIAVRKRDKLRGLPLSPGCVSVYIRHGDKHTEHKTYNDSAYEEALVALREIDPSLTDQVFLSTEDPATVTYFTNASRGWSTSYVDMPRKPDRKKNNIVYMKEHGFAEEMLDGLLNLDLALQCDGFVSSINSNWARLIDELRNSIRCKAHAKYMDVGLRSPKGFFFWF